MNALDGCWEKKLEAQSAEPEVSGVCGEEWANVCVNCR
jgi:hypothetical protein